jgi:hypothetical protein
MTGRWAPCARPWRVLVFTSLVLASLVPVPAFGQVASAAPGEAVAAPGILSRYRFHLSAVRFSIDEPEFNWDADFGGDLDLLDYGAGRVTFLSNYEVILGDERREFDPVQGNYTIALSASYRIGANEVFGVFHHVSRHRSDRPRVDPVDWNSMGVRLLRSVSAGRLRAVGSVHALWSVERSTVDYEAEYGAEGRVEYALARRQAVFGAAAVHTFTTDETVASRSRQNGGRLEGGLRLSGAAASLELVVAVERRVDADPVQPGPRTWGYFGFRLLHP